MNSNYYEILGIKPDALKDEIKSAFRAMARKYHPDVNHTFEAEIKFKQINLAAKTLLDDKSRSNYDFAFGFNQKSEEEVKQTADKARDTYRYASYEYGKKTDFKKNFEEFFKSKEKPKSEPKLKKIDGEDIITHVTISAQEVFEGTTRKVNILVSEKCPKCFGHKFINGSKCSFCSGEGEKISYKKISVKIPPYVREGTKIRVKSQGQEGKNGGKNGNLYLIVHIEKESIFKITNDAASLDVPITPLEAILGANIRVPTPDGVKILKIPPMTKTNTVFKLVECGFLDKASSKRGELLIKAVIDIPSNLSDKERELCKVLYGMNSENIRKELFDKYEQNSN